MRTLALVIIALTLLLSGCATTIRSEVTAFHQWPATLPGPAYVFMRAAPADLERQNYEQLLRERLAKLGLREAATGEPAPLAVTMDYRVNGRDVRVIETVLVDPWYGTPWYGPGYYSPYWGWPGYGHPFYGPMWPAMPVAREQQRRYTVFHRELKLRIDDVAKKQPLYDVTVRSDGEDANLAKVMPYLIASAFRDFPGKNGVPQVVEMKMER
ncbi:MAG: hypothetical protein RL404_348 [Pseudomonadota bacterium]